MVNFCVKHVLKHATTLRIYVCGLETERSGEKMRKRKRKLERNGTVNEEREREREKEYIERDKLEIESRRKEELNGIEKEGERKNRKSKRYANLPVMYYSHTKAVVLHI